MKYFITFGNNEFSQQTLRLKKEAEQTLWFDKVIIENQNTISYFYETHKNFIANNTRGFGYWIWKPYIIHQLLSSIPFNSYVFYTDSGASIISHKYNRLLEYIELLDSSTKPILTFAAQYEEKSFKKSKTLDYFGSMGYGLVYDESFLNSYQVESGVLICKKTPFVIDFIKQWLDLCLLDNYSLVTDSKDNEPNYFIEHRHDQSILSVLCKINKSHIICCDEAYGNGPFFSSRLTDNLPRRFAPDLFRTDSRYDPSKHFTWQEWLNDYPDIRFNYDLLLENLDKIIQ
jgi:hypothetical protein